jgi:hypothetical protein
VRSQDPLRNAAVQEMRNSKPGITVWDTETGSVLFTEADDKVSLFAVAISRDGRFLAGAGTSMFLWDVDTRHLLQRFDLPGSAVAFSRDGTVLAGASGTDIHIWSVATGAETAVLSGHLGRINSLVFDGNGRLASGSQDGSVKVWDVTKKAEVVTLFPIDDHDYVIATPENYYMTSRSGVRGVAFRVGERVFPFEQFDLRYNRPDKVLARLGSAPAAVVQGLRSLAEERVIRSGFLPHELDQLGDDFHLPELRIADPGPPLSSNAPFVRFTVKASDSLYELNRVNIYVDGVPVKGFAGVGLSQRHTKSVDEELMVSLANGQNKIQVSVVNERGTESLADTAKVTYTGQAPKPELYLLAIGVSKYSIPKNNLRYPADDARAIEQFWRSGAGQFNSVHTQVFEDRNATKDKILLAKKFLAGAGVDDVVVLFLAGHGVLDTDGKYYFGTWDFRPGVPSEKGLQYGDIESLLDGITARKRLVLIDTCHAGGDDLDDVLRERFADLRRGTGAHVIAASGGLKEALESNEFGSGTFTRALLDGLGGKADANGDGEVSVSELRDYVARHVPILSHGRQKPSVRAENLDSNFTLAKSR